MGGSDDGELNPRRPRYDISMSKRTRKPRVTLDEAFVENDAKRPDQRGEENNEHMSWKKLVTSISGSKEEHTKEVKEEPAGDHGKPGRSSLGQHFTEEEKQLQLVTQHKQELVKFKGMMGHYVKVWSFFMKAKQVEPVYKAGSIRPKKKKPPILWEGKLAIEPRNLINDHQVSNS